MVLVLLWDLPYNPPVPKVLSSFPGCAIVKPALHESQHVSSAIFDFVEIVFESG
jgi:hypothetical protein